MKTYRRLFDGITAFPNLLLAARLAQRGKRFRGEVARFNFGLERNLLKLREELISGEWTPGEYHRFTVFEPKERPIVAAPYRDRVVHHALCNVIEPLFERGFMEESYACREGKGTHAALDRAQHFLRLHKFVLRCDVRKFFFSINHETLYSLVSKKIACGRTLALIRKIIGLSGAGVPIGNLTSQLFANIYLNELDRFVKQGLGRRGYLRYMDDFLVFGDCKRELAGIKDSIAGFLRDKLQLELKANKSFVLPAWSGLGFLGFRLFPCYRRLDGANVAKFVRRYKEMRADWREVGLRAIKDSLRAWVAHTEHANTWNLRTELLAGVNF
ncbi:MAG: reverse transcriptase/maturase family protein [Elusimicrobiota bacterium]|nr:reverse transcriptase/maturase family protein [Elusimicrobiota bacterium]